MPAADRRLRIPERTVQADIVHLLRLIGFEVWTLGTTRRRGDHPGTMQSAGLPDLIAGGRGRCLMVEVKARGGQLRPAQVRFRAMCQAAGVDHVAGGLDEVIAWLQTAGILAAQHVMAATVGELPEEGEAD